MIFQGGRHQIAVALGKMLSIWKADDFKPQEAGSDGVKDHWEPECSAVPVLKLVNPDLDLLHLDFWDPVSALSEIPSFSSTKREAAWFDYVELPHFEARASEDPFTLPRTSFSKEALSARRARWLLSLLDVPAPRDRKAILRQFVELFEHFDHVNTFVALSALALDDVTADEILTAFYLKLVWADSPKFWSMRRSKFGTLFVPQKGQAMLSWTKAVHFGILSKGLPAERIVQEDWFDEWLLVPFGDPSFYSFLYYAALRLEAFAMGVLDLPIELKRSDENGLPLARFGGNAIDGVYLGSSSRTGQLVNLKTDAWLPHADIAKVLKRTLSI